MNNLLLFLLIFITTKTYASCGVPKLIPDDEQVGLRQKVILKVNDKDFLNNSGMDLITIEIPEKFKDKLLDKAFVTYWDGDKVVLHTSLELREGYSYIDLADKNGSGSKVMEFSINGNLSYIPKLTLLFGDMCYSRLQLNIDNLSDFAKQTNEEEWFENSQNYIFKQGR
jgi:hypothetical protein